MAIGHWLKNFTKWYFNPEIEGGGGGSSDFSAAQVTFLNSNENIAYSVNVPTLNDEYGVLQDYAGIEYDMPHTCTIPLYKGKATIPIDSFSGVGRIAVPTLTGDITFDGTAVIIEGDGTITFAGA